MDKIFNRLHDVIENYRRFFSRAFFHLINQPLEPEHLFHTVRGFNDAVRVHHDHIPGPESHFLFRVCFIRENAQRKPPQVAV